MAIDTSVDAMAVDR